MWARQQYSPRRKRQSLPSSPCSASLPKLFLQPITNPNFSGTQFSNSTPNSIHRTHQFFLNTSPYPSIRSTKFSITTDAGLIQTETNQQNYKFAHLNNYNTNQKDFFINKYPSKIGDELSFENGKPYTSSFIFFNCRHFLTPIEEKEIKNYTEIFYLRRKPKKKKLAFHKNMQLKDKDDNDNKLFTECFDYENNFTQSNEKIDGLEMNSNYIYNRIDEKLNSEVKFNDILNDNNEFEIGDHIAYRYEILSKIGSGAFGIVFKCFDHKMNHEVALKMIKETHENHPEIVLEAKFLENLQCGCKQHHIVELYESFTFRNYFCISMELIDSNSEQENTSKSKVNDDNERIKFHFSNHDLLQLFDAINFIHLNGILHCDLKPSNILFHIEKMKSPIPNNNSKNIKKNDNFISHDPSNSKSNYNSCKSNPNIRKSANSISNHRILKIIDFGCSCFLGQCPYEKIQSLNYRAPEVILKLMPYTAAIDIWSIGCIIYEVTIGCPLFNSSNELELINEIAALIGEPPFWMMNTSNRKSKFFIEINGKLQIKPVANNKQSIAKKKYLNKFNYKNNDDGLIKNINDHNNELSPLQTCLNECNSNNDDLIKSSSDYNNSKSQFQISPIENNNNCNSNIGNVFKVCSPSSKNTTARKNILSKSNVSLSTLRERISSAGNPFLLSLLEGCLTWDPSERMTANQLLDHPWSKNIK